MTPSEGELPQPPLTGRTVVVTRAREQASSLVARLEELGAETIELPVIAIAEPSDSGAALRAAARRLVSYDWLVFTSVNAVERFMAVLEDPEPLMSVRVAAIGPGTARALAPRGVAVDLLPERFLAEALLEVFPPPPAGTEGRVLLPHAADARDVLPVGLRAAGWHVDVVEAYRTEQALPPPSALARVAKADAITFTASSTVTAYLAVTGEHAVPPVVACIGPVTAGTARRHGLKVDVEPEEHTLDGLVAALAAALGPRPRS